jgi:hypothetical protein
MVSCGGGYPQNTDPSEKSQQKDCGGGTRPVFDHTGLPVGQADLQAAAARRAYAALCSLLYSSKAAR